MKPDHEINGRCFAEATVDNYNVATNRYYSSEKFLHFTKRNSGQLSMNEVNIQLELKDYFVELDRFKVQPSNPPQDGFRIKLDQEGKAVVLTELPKNNECEFCKDIKSGEESGCCFECGRHIPKSPDELADEILRNSKNSQNIPITDYLSPDGFLWKTIIKSMQECHRIKSDGLLTCSNCDKDIASDEPITCQKCLHDIVRENKDGLFTREEMIEFAEWLSNSDKKYPIVTMFDNWLMIKSYKFESRDKI